MRFIRRYSRKICLAAIDDLTQLSTTVEKEIADLKRYKTKIGDKETLTYITGIEKREQLKTEIDAVKGGVENILNAFSTLHDFADVLRGENYLVAVGKCESNADVLRFFYRETLKRAKQKYGVAAKPRLKSDPFALCLIEVKLGFQQSLIHN